MVVCAQSFAATQREFARRPDARMSGDGCAKPRISRSFQNDKSTVVSALNLSPELPRGSVSPRPSWPLVL